jgi:hypothetical protein
MDKHTTNSSTIKVITQKMSNWIHKKNNIEAITSAPDASAVLTIATQEEQKIGWEQWLKERWTMEWASLQNYNIQTVDLGIKHNSGLTFEFAFNIWTERNKIEHDTDGDPKKRKKEKIIEIIMGDLELTNYQVYIC